MGIIVNKKGTQKNNRQTSKDYCRQLSKNLINISRQISQISLNANLDICFMESCIKINGIDQIHNHNQFFAISEKTTINRQMS